MVDRYVGAGNEVPEVLSVWTTFPLGGSNIPTLFAPIANDVQGIGLEHEYGGDGRFESPLPPLRAVLLHNNLLALPERATQHHADLAGYAEYLFLLELSHIWGPALRLPGNSDRLIGFAGHWSFYLDAGQSPAGGNRWHDNGNGTFTVGGAVPGDVAYSDLDLYAMGLLPAESVQPFALLTNVVVPPDSADPLNGGNVTSATFPWFDTTPLTVEAVREAHTIEEIVEANGPRSPSFPEARRELSVGFVMVTGEDNSVHDVMSAQATFEPIANALSSAYERATRSLGTMRVVTSGPAVGPDLPDAGDIDASTIVDASDETPEIDAPAETTVDSGPVRTHHEAGCTVISRGSHASPWPGTLMLMLLGLAVTRRLREICRVGALLAMGSVSAFTVFGCETQTNRAVVGQEQAAILDGTPDNMGASSGVFVVWQDEHGDAYGCSGTVLSANLILTGVHCVVHVSSPNCSDDDPSRIEMDSVGSQYYVSSNPVVDADATYIRGDARIFPAVGAPACGNDLAVIQLDSPLEDVLAVEPRFEPPDVGEPVSVVGYGNNGAVVDANYIRRRRDDRRVISVGRTTNGDRVVTVDNEWMIDEGPCGGDSGGPALDAQGKLVGIMSRGSPATCQSMVYNRIDTAEGWLKEQASLAALALGDTPPDWVTNVANPEDAGAMRADATVDSGLDSGSTNDAEPAAPPDAGAVNHMHSSGCSLGAPRPKHAGPVSCLISVVGLTATRRRARRELRNRKS